MLTSYGYQLIAIYTFIGVSTGKGLESMRVTVALVVGIWVFIGILIGFGFAVNRGRYMSPVPVSFFFNGLEFANSNRFSIGVGWAQT